MIKVELKGVARISARGKIYYYAWRGGPRLSGEPGSAEFHQSYIEAHDTLRELDAGKFRSLVVLYKASPDFRELAASTRKNWNPWLDRIADYFGDLRIAQFDRPEKIRPVIRKWRSHYATTPRTADYGIQVLSRVLSYAIDPLGKIAANPCEGVKQLYSGDRAEIIWSDREIERLKRSCSPEITWVVDLAVESALRLGDLLKLSWSHIQDHEIVIRTGKGRRKGTEAVIPIHDALRVVLEAIPRRSPVILTNTFGRPWTRDGFSSSFHKAKFNAGMGDEDLHFHDLRGTAATRLYKANVPERSIAEIMGWDERYVGKIIRRYVGRHAATREVILQLRLAKEKKEK